jgi:hypothetical protein
VFCLAEDKGHARHACAEVKVLLGRDLRFNVAGYAPDDPMMWVNLAREAGREQRLTASIVGPVGPR